MFKKFPIWINIAFVFYISAPTFVVASGDPLAGEKKSLICSACHGAQGISSNPEWPHLAGQHATYFIKQLHDFKQGTRPAAIMGPLVTNLSEQDMEDLADYYTKLPPSQTPKTSEQNVSGEALYRHGDSQKHITACITCHGPDGKGNAQAGFPWLSHQSSLYTIQQLQAFKSGQRQNDLNGIMHDISSHLSDEDIKALADYMATINSDKSC